MLTEGKGMERENNDYIDGLNPNKRFCMCGCKNVINSKDKKNRDVFWIKGHNARGKKSSNYRNRNLIELYRFKHYELVEQIISLQSSLDSLTGSEQKVQRRLIELVNREKYWFQACEILIDNDLMGLNWEGFPDDLKKCDLSDKSMSTAE